MRTHALRSALLALALLGAAGCGGDEASDRTDYPRVSRQVLSRADGAVVYTWRYDYDATGLATTVRLYDAVDLLSSVTTYSYTGDRRVRAATVNPAGDPTSVTDYRYDARGVLAGSTTTSSTGAVIGTVAYEFHDGRKTKTSRYDASAVLVSWTTFSYGPTGERTGVTTYDAAGTVTGTGTRVFEGGHLAEVIIVNEGTTSHRTFTYEEGPNRIDPDLFYEF